MRLRSSQWRATTSAALVILLLAAPAKTARRPRYGGRLRVEIGAAVQSLDSSVAAATMEEASAKAEIDALIFDTSNIDTVKIETLNKDRSDGKAALPAAGAFRISEWVPGKELTLAANEDYPQGRPFVDSVEITMGRRAKDRMLDLELGKTDFIEIPQDQARRAADAGVRESESQADELVAILFAVRSMDSSPSEGLMAATAKAVDRNAIVNFVLQKTGEPAGGLLPQWLSGTAFLFSTTADPAAAKKQAEELRAENPALTQAVLGYDSGDSVEQAVAERIVVNAREAEISMTAKALPARAPASAEKGFVPTGFDAKIVRWRVPSKEPAAAIAGFLAAFPQTLRLGTGACEMPAGTAGAEAVYRCEQAIVDAHEIVPVAFLPEVYGLSARVRDWQAPKAGESWPLADVWLEENP